MTRRQIEELNGQVITEEQAEEIQLNEEVVNFESMGKSGNMRGYEWFSVDFEDGQSIDVYMRQGG